MLYFEVKRAFSAYLIFITFLGSFSFCFRFERMRNQGCARVPTAQTFTKLHDRRIPIRNNHGVVYYILTSFHSFAIESRRRVSAMCRVQCVLISTVVVCIRSCCCCCCCCNCMPLSSLAILESWFERWLAAALAGSGKKHQKIAYRSNSCRRRNFARPPGVLATYSSPVYTPAGFIQLRTEAGIPSPYLAGLLAREFYPWRQKTTSETELLFFARAVELVRDGSARCFNRVAQWRSLHALSQQSCDFAC